jgi:ankyrin repeat protein
VLAIESENKDLLRSLSDSFLAEKWKKRWTPLAWAIEKSSATMVGVLLFERGADINGEFTLARDWWTPLGYAEEKGDVEVVRLLVDSGADLHKDFLLGAGDDAWAGTRWTPLGFALQKSNQTGDVEIVRLLLRSADPDKEEMRLVNGGSLTPLGYVVTLNNAALVRLLLEHRVDPHLRPVSALLATWSFPIPNVFLIPCSGLAVHFLWIWQSTTSPPRLPSLYCSCFTALSALMYKPSTCPISLWKCFR